MTFIGVHWGKDTLLKKYFSFPSEERITEGTQVLVRGQIYQIEQASDYQMLYLKNNSISYHKFRNNHKHHINQKDQKNQKDQIDQKENHQKESHQEQNVREPYVIIYVSSGQKFQIGNIVEASGEFKFFEEERNPGGFSQKLYYRTRKIAAYLWSDKVQCVNEDTDRFRNSLNNFRLRWKSLLMNAAGEEDGGILCAVLLGEKRQIDGEVKELYQVNGMAHILAISGLHLSFIGVGIYKILRRITGSYPVGGAFGILFLMLYILMIGLTVSAIRALVMFLFRVGADMVGRHYDAPTALSAAAVTVLVWRPLSLYDGGFWLSFGAVLAILAVVPVVQRDLSVYTLHSDGQQAKGSMLQSSLEQKKDGSLPVYLRKFWELWRVILQGLTVSIGINLVILPILLYYFFEFPMYSFVLNLFVIPLMSVLLFLGMAGSLLALWLPSVSSFLFWVCGRILCFYQISCKAALHLPGSRLVAGRPEIWQIAVYYGILFLGLMLMRYTASMKEQDKQGEKRSQGYQRHGKDWRFKQSDRADKSIGFNNRMSGRTGRSAWKEWFVVFLWVAGIIILTTRFGESGKLTTVVLDVGQGDGIFIKGPEGVTYLVDGGSSDVKKVGRYRLEPFLKSQGVGTLDYVLISHGDSDHMNGVEELIERQDIGVKIRTLVLPVQEVWDEALMGLAEKARDNGIRVVVIEPGQSIREEEMAVTCIQPGDMGIKSEDAGSRQENTMPETGSIIPVTAKLEPGNEASMVLAVQYGQFDMLLTGDVEGEGEKKLTKQLEESYSDCTWEILKVAHHGSKNSSAEEFLRLIRPVYAFVSAGQENRYGHPHQETVERLTDVGSRIYSTQENGAIIVEVEDGEQLRMEKWKR